MTAPGTAAQPPPRGEVITFYSYKGGTGRSLALANVACALAQRRKDSRPVLLVDWDLEAPGLHVFFPLATGSTSSSPTSAMAPPEEASGVLELFEDISNRLREPSAPTAEATEEAIAAFVDDLDLAPHGRPTHVSGISLVPAGRMDSTYAKRVAAFDWAALHARAPWLFAALAERWGRENAYTLIDSRTGITDTSGICTALLPEKLVVAFTPNRQSLFGVDDLVRRVTSHRKASTDLRPLMVFPLPSRIDDSEEKLRNAWRWSDPTEGVLGYQPLFEQTLQESYGLESCSLEAYFHAVGILHFPSPAYGERLVFLEQSRHDQLARAAPAYERIAEYLSVLRAPWQRIEEAKALGQARALMEEATAALASGRASAALERALAASSALESVDAAEDPGLSDLFVKIAETLVSAGQFEAGASALSRAVRVRQRVLGDANPRLIALLDALASAESRAGMHESAKAHAVRALDVARVTFAHDEARLRPHAERLSEVIRVANPASEGATAATGTGADTESPRGVAVGANVAGSVIVTGDGNTVVMPSLLFPGGSHARGSSLEKDTLDYLDHLVGIHRYLQFRGMGVHDRVPLRIALADQWVPLRARPHVEVEGDDTKRRNRKPPEGPPTEDGRRERQPVLDLLRDASGLVVLGDPGSGKTTLLKFLALRCASGDGPALGLGHRLPFVISLAAYARAAARQSISIADFVVADCEERGIRADVRALLSTSLERGNALVLLDGLDEVRVHDARGRIANLIGDFFVAHARAGSKFVMTSRVVGYDLARIRHDGLAECTLDDFDDDDVKAFVEKWCGALESAARGAGPTAEREAKREHDELLEAVQANEGVRRLASNPLLLTILALMKRQGIRLPDRRVELYQKHVETLLTTWRIARSETAGRTDRDLDAVAVIKVLAPLALWMHETSPGLGLVKRGALRGKLAEILHARGESDPDAAAGRFIEDLRGDAGLLVERGAGEYAFLHLTFQEYLAAVAIAERGQLGVAPVVEALAARVSDANWREVTRLAIAYLGIVQQRDEAAGHVLMGLCEVDGSKPGQAVCLAGEALGDAWPGGVPQDVRRQVIERLLRAVRGEDGVAPIERAAAGDVLARLGDPRFGDDAWFLPADAMLGFLEVPAGPFLMGSDRSRDTKALASESPPHEVTLPRFLIARWPVTVAQFRAYLEATERKPEDPDALADPVNRPVRWVSWYEAMRYCEWLTERLREFKQTPEPLATLLRKGADGRPWRVTLASEAEWEKAGRGTDGRKYPWGEKLTPEHANYGATNIETTSAVGCFPTGRSPCGAEEMSGNVWEWTRSLWGEDWQKPSFAYPYVATDGREDPKATDGVHRVVRGGSFDSDPLALRCADRGRFLPLGRRGFIGFRVVVSPFFSEL